MTALVPALREAGECQVFRVVNPFTLERAEARVAHGQTIAEIMHAVGCEGDAWSVFVGDVFVPREFWARTRPKAGSVVTIHAVPRGGGGGQDQNKVLRTVLQVIVLIIAIALTWVAGPSGAGWLSATQALWLGAAVGAAGNILIAAFLPPQFGTPGRGKQQPLGQSITGARNTANPFGPIARVYGRHRIFPFYGAEPFTEIEGDDQYLRMLFDLGYGPLDVTDLRIGDTPIDVFEGVEYEVRQPGEPTTLYTNDTAEDSQSVKLTTSWDVRVTRQECNEISVDVVCPRGLFRQTRSGRLDLASVHVEIEYRAVGATDWLGAPWINIQEARSTPIRRSARWRVPLGQYEVRVRRFNPEDDERVTETWWATLRAIRYTEPVATLNTTRVALRIKATDQLNGVIDTFNCLVTSRLRTWNGSAWEATPTATRNPAAVYLDILTGTAMARPIPDSRIDLEGLGAWYEECEASGRHFDHVVDYRTTVFELLKTVAPVGRAAFAMPNGKYGVVRDVPQTVPVQHFTPRNSFGFSGRKAFPDRVHGFKIRFINAAKDYQQDERVVYDDGFDATNATKFETLEAVGITDSDQAWRYGRYYLANLRLRPEIYELSTDVEHLICQKGDLVRVTHDVMLVGLHAGRVKAVQVDGSGNATGVTVDERVTMVAGTTYGMRFRRTSDGGSVTATVVTVDGPDQATITFASPIAAADKPAAGDLFMFGELGEESIECIVKAIYPGRDLTARLELVDAAPDIHDAETGVIPPFDSHITLAPPSVRRPPAPIIEHVISDETALVRAIDGALESRIYVKVHFASGAHVPAAYVEARFRRTGSQAAWSQLRAPVSGDSAELSIQPVQDGIAYDLRLRTVGAAGETSEWVDVLGHQVIGKSTPPPDVPALLLEGRVLKWAYPDAPRDLAGFRLRRHFGERRSWEDAQAVHDGLLSATSYPLPLLDSGTVTYLLKAVDVAGNESAAPATLVKDLGDLRVSNVLETIDKKAAGWPGTHNGLVDAGNLKANTAGTFWSATLGKPFWTADGDPFWTEQYLALEYLTSVLPDVDQVPCALLIDAEVAAAGYTLEYRIAGSGLFWADNNAAVFWSGNDAALMWTPSSGFLPWPGRLEGATRQVYEFLLRTNPGPVQGVISGYKVILDVPDLEESLEDVAILAAGTRLPITQSYRVIKTVNLTVQDDGGTAITAKVFDKDPALGPLVRCLDAAGTAVNGLVDATIQGY